MKILCACFLMFSTFLVSALPGGRAAAEAPVVPEDVLSPAEITQIKDSKNFFLFRNLDQKTPVWISTQRKYSSHFFYDRGHLLHEDEVLHRILTDSFSIRYQLESLYRAKMGIHVAIGNVLPRVEFLIGQGVEPLAWTNTFANLFGFLLPSNWLQIPSQQSIYKATKYLLMQRVFDGVLQGKLAYLRQHQLIQEFEIINFYFIHLQIFLSTFPPGTPGLSTMVGRIGTEGTRMAAQREQIRLGFDQLALLMALQQADGQFSASQIDIADIADFPRRVRELDEVAAFYGDKERFLEEVVRRSVELKAVQEFYKMSLYNIGIVGSGGTLANIDNPLAEARFAVRVGYGTIPSILIARSFAESARIDVQREYIGMLDNARRSYDFYLNALQSYTEAKRALRDNRKAFQEILTAMTAAEPRPDTLFLFLLALIQLLEGELFHTNALHGALRAQAYMDRFLLLDTHGALAYLPSRGKIMEVYQDVIGEQRQEVRQLAWLDYQFEHIHKASHLRAILYQHERIPEIAGWSDREIEEAVGRNIGGLLLSKGGFTKSRKFYQVLRGYLDAHPMRLTAQESYTLKKKSASFWDRMFRRKRVFGADDYFENFNFEDFGAHHP